MTPMIGQVDLLLSAVRAGKLAPEQIAQKLERIRSIMDQYVKRASTLLDVSRITTGKFVLEPAPCDFAVLAREVAGSYADAARYAKCAIDVEAPDSLQGVWDRLAAEQIVDNLVSNAIKYGAGKPVVVCAEARGDGVRLRVRDHGPGIAAGDRARIFGRFEQAAGPDRRRGGFGVGLWVVGQLVEAMGGTVIVDDAQGGGSVFTVDLPRYTAADRP